MSQNHSSFIRGSSPFYLSTKFNCAFQKTFSKGSNCSKLMKIFRRYPPIPNHGGPSKLELFSLSVFPDLLISLGGSLHGCCIFFCCCLFICFEDPLIRCQTVFLVTRSTHKPLFSQQLEHWDLHLIGIYSSFETSASENTIRGTVFCCPCSVSF